jgi:hypothetical protein
MNMETARHLSYAADHAFGVVCVGIVTAEGPSRQTQSG